MVMLLIRRPRTLLPILLAFLPIAAFTGFYNYRVTGSANRLPYMEYDRQYEVAPVFYWQPLHPAPQFRHPAIREFAVNVEVPAHYHQATTLAAFARFVAAKVGSLLGAIIAPWLLVAGLLAVPLAASVDRRVWMAVGVVAAVLLATLVTNWTHVQYVAPATAALLLLVTAGTWAIERQWPGVGAGVLMGCIAGALWVSVGASLPTLPSQRAQLVRGLRQVPGKYLVVVEYASGHPPNEELVFNAADIDAADIVWARDMGEAENRKLLHYFKDREAWHVRVVAEGSMAERLPSTQ
jgi:hypothetical protein